MTEVPSFDTPAGSVLVVGDWHGDRGAIDRALWAAQAAGVNLLIHLGDFGFHWPGDEGQFEYRVHRRLEELDMRMVVIDGNHDNHTYLAGLPEFEDGPLRCTRPRFAGESDRLLYAPRGARFEVDGVLFGALGGAFSIDLQWRTPHIDWWPDEAPSAGEAHAMAAAGPVDVLLTHDAPTSGRPPFPFMIRWDLDARSRAVSDLLEGVANEISPALVLHGHHHVRHTSKTETGIRVEGLADSTEYGNYALLDLSTLALTDLDERPE